MQDYIVICIIYVLILLKDSVYFARPFLLGPLRQHVVFLLSLNFLFKFMFAFRFYTVIAGRYYFLTSVTFA